MALYEIRTLKTRHRVSLVSYCDFASDLAAILAARKLARRGEAFEVWRTEKLIYRTGLSAIMTETKPAAKPKGDEKRARVPVWRILEILAGKVVS